MFASIYDRIYEKVIYKFSLIFTGIYFVIFNGNHFEHKIYFYIIISFATSAGIAGIGYMLNDYIDLENDIKNNKKNIFTNKSKLQVLLLVFIFATFAINPWFFFPVTLLSLFLIGAEVFLLFAYAFPPFRLKEKAVLGIICDSLYAQVIPCILAIHTFYLIGDNFEYKNEMLYFYVLWLFVLGIRNILLHQLEDYLNDKNTNTQTFATTYGLSQTKIIIKYSIFFELFFFSLFLYCLPKVNFIVIVFYIAYLFLLLLLKNKFSFFFVNERVLNEFYEIHLPILLLVLYTLQEPKFIYFLVFNIVLLSPIYYKFGKGFLAKYL